MTDTSSPNPRAQAWAPPQEWASIHHRSIDVSDIVGLPGMPARPARRRAEHVIGAFATAEELGTSSPTLSAAAPATAGLESVSAFQVMGVRPVRWTAADHLRSAGGSPVDAAGVLPTAALGGDADLRPVHTLVSATGTHAVVQQQLRGHDVVGARMVLHQDTEGTYSATGRPIGDLGRRDPGSPPDDDVARVRRAVRSQFSVAPGMRLAPKLVVLPVDGSARWAWLTRVSLVDPDLDARVYLAAGTLEPLLVYPVSVTAYGEAMLHPVNPTRSTEGPVRMCLRDLDPDPAGPLRGAWIDVDATPADAFASPERDYACPAGDPRIDQVAAYHHLSAGLRWFGERVRPELLDQKMFRPLRVVARNPNVEDNARFDPDRSLITFGVVTAKNEGFATSVDIAMHELTHAVTHAICRLSDTFVGEPRSLNEGYSDYFACSSIGSPEVGDHVAPEYARSCARADLPNPPPFGLDNPYPLGEVWANVLWGIREQLGAPVADALVIESLYFAQTLVTVGEGVGALHMADAALFPAPGGGGRHAEVIDAEVAARSL